MIDIFLIKTPLWKISVAAFFDSFLERYQLLGLLSKNKKLIFS